MTWTSSDERWMLRALELAARGRFTTWPNPMVGCVVVENDQLLGEGWHMKHGEAHAEVHALAQVDPKKDLSNATAYVTLEPCSHTGKTPPCADLLVSRGVGRVVVASQDPNPEVSGRGLSRLGDAQCQVDVGCLEKEALELNRAFMHAMTSSRPWITLKWAQSQDGYVDPDLEAPFGRGGCALTGAQSGRHTHTLRATHDGILVGMRTWLVDRPSLTTRHVPGSNPARFILTSGQSPKPENAPVLSGNDTATLVCPAEAIHSPALLSWMQAGYGVLALRGLAFSEAWWTDFKAQTSIAACMVEGGAQVAQGVLDSRCWDEVHVLEAPEPLGHGLAAPPCPESDPHVFARLGEDLLTVWRADSISAASC